LNEELLRNLEAVEKEKNLNRAFMIDILRTGLLSAFKKMFPDVDNYDIQVDPMTADIKVLQNGVEIYDADFSRIAAQTAKQVIFQKIREAERDAIFKEFSEKIGSIITGEVHRIEGNNIIVSLGDVEAVIPRREQIYQEEYHQGDHIKAYVVEVRKSYRGPDIILSRTHPFFVKKLFEIEVPEISENIVEIKGVAREAGYRTKIAVYSKDDKVDCVGSCVGMRGQRVKSIVDELRGEKIDIVRWNPDHELFIRNSLSPAEILKVTLFENDKHAEVLVADDQLSLAIGKRGQNIRLSSKLTGWQLEVGTSAHKVFLKELEGVGEKVEEVLKAAGIHSVKDILKHTVDDLKELPGVGPKTAQKIIDAAHKVFLKSESKEKPSLSANVLEERAQSSGSPKSRKEEIFRQFEDAFKDSQAAQAQETSSETEEKKPKKKAVRKKAAPKKETVQETPEGTKDLPEAAEPAEIEEAEEKMTDEGAPESEGEGTAS